MSKTTAYTKKVMEDLDALLADLQSTTASVSYSHSAPPKDPPPASVSSPANRTSSNSSSPRPQVSYSLAQSNQAGRTRHTPPPLPPPPSDIPDTIPPPQQFGDQPLYEAQNVRQQRDTRDNRRSGSSQGSAADHSYYSHTSAPPASQHQGSSMISNNLSELDQLLSDLNSAQFMAEVDKKHSAPPTPTSGTITTAGKPPPPVAPKPGRGGGGGVNSVDNLLDQLENSVPHSAGPHGGYPVQNNSVNGSFQSSVESQSYSYGESHAQHSQAPQSSSATQELDDLMQSLSGFKMKDKAGGGQQHQMSPQMPPPPRSPSPGSEPSYAKPHKSRSLSHSSSANTSLQSGNVSVGSAPGGQLESMLGDLQSDLSKQGVNTKTKGLCAACNQPVVGQVITALGKIWHIEHFSCFHCRETLGTKNFYERDGVAYCERDYHALFAPRCAYCNGPITDKCVTAMDSTWHPEHFFCAQCGRPFGDDGFHERDGKAYCRADFFEMFAPKCGGCARAIVDNYISALNRHWHPECFACFECHVPFAGGKFFDYEGLPYCETHYHTKRGSLCAGCQKPISGRCITAMSRKFHPEHFVCAFCLKQLNKGTFKEQNDRPYCHPCFVKLFG